MLFHRVGATAALLFVFWCLFPPEWRRVGYILYVALFAWAFIQFGERIASLLGDTGGVAESRIVDSIIRGIGWVLLLFCAGAAVLIRF